MIEAVRRYGARGVCVDIDPRRIEEARANAVRAGVTDRIDFLTQDLFATDLGEVSVVMLRRNSTCGCARSLSASSRRGRASSRTGTTWATGERRARFACAATAANAPCIFGSCMDAVEIETGPEPRAAVIWLHGGEADGHDFEPIVPELELEQAVRFVFPHAPMRPVTINNGHAHARLVRHLPVRRRPRGRSGNPRLAENRRNPDWRRER